MKYTKALAILFLTAGLSGGALAQSKKVTLPANWYNLDLTADKYFGISTEKAYSQLLKNKKPKAKIIVAVLDGGTDVNHEDLRPVLWTNKKEIPGNGKDDDGNGYIDDVHGWNFIGGKTADVHYDNTEAVRLLRILSPKYKGYTNLTKVDTARLAEFNLYKKLMLEYGKKYEEAYQTFGFLNAIKSFLAKVAAKNNVKTPTQAQVEAYKDDEEITDQIKKVIRRGSNEEGYDEFIKEIAEGYDAYDAMLKYHLNGDYDPRAEIVGDDYNNSAQRIYGNNHYEGPDGKHGTHVAGIIGGKRNNGLGINGVADNVEIMVVRAVPDGDERDKDVANGIRYAVDNGARVINMSFGKGFKYDKKAVDDAVKYAAAKGVLLVHAAGNDNADNDKTDNYPNKYYDSPENLAYQKKQLENMKDAEPPKINRAPGAAPAEKPVRPVKPLPEDEKKFSFAHAANWIEVGASAYAPGDDLKANFSNYGKHNVDVFAPGFLINSTVPGSKYQKLDGTSMAAPVVSGLAALILSYYPKLTPVQVREIIMKSVTKVPYKVKNKNADGGTERVNFSDLCVSGGIVNAYNALKLAAQY